MQVFKTFFKIVYKNLIPITVYLIIFVTIAVLLSNQLSYVEEMDFEDKKLNMAIFNYDNDSEFTKNFQEYIKKYANIINIDDSKEAIQDALYYNKVEYVIRIPNNFTNELFNGNQNLEIEKTSVAGATTSSYIDLIINKYMNAAKTYVKSIPNITQEKLQKYLEEDMQLKVDYKINFYEKTVNNNKAVFYFTYYAYVIFAVMILAITSVMMAFNNTDLRKRNLSSPVKISNYNMQIVSSSFIFTVAAWLIISALSVVIYGTEILNSTFLLLFINALIISLVALSISFFIGNFLKSKNAQSAVANILSLGLSFLSGVFVPQELISPTVLKVASFMPPYWYVKAVNDIKVLTVWSSENLLPIIYSMLIQLGFALAILLVALIVIRQRRTSSQ